MEILHPPHWARPKGYANGIKAKGTLVFVAGQVGWDENEVFQSTDLVDQAKQALINIKTILHEAGAETKDIVRMTWFITDEEAYLGSQVRLGKVYQEVIGKHYPAMSLLIIKALVEKGAKVEIEATAILEDSSLE